MAEFGIPYTLETPRGTLTFNAGGSDYFLLSGVDNMDGGSVRAPLDPRPRSDGVIVHDFYRGARQPVLQGQIVAQSGTTARREMEDQLRSYTDSILRADGILRFTPSGGSTRRLTVRLLEAVQIRGGYLKEFQIALVAGDPLTYSDTLQSASTNALTTSSGGGLTLPFSFPFSFGDFTAGGVATIVNNGNAPTFPTVRIVGPISAPVIRNATTGKLLSLPGLSISAGDYAAIDMQAGTVRLNDSAANSLLRYLDVAASEFWGLEPGSNSLQLTGSGFTSATTATVLWRDAYI